MARRRTSSIVSVIIAELRVARLTWLTNVRAAMSNRIAFSLQVGGMALNDCAFVAVWLLFFHVLGSVNGWGGIESIGLLGFATASFGLAFGFFGGSPYIHRYVEDGSMDGFLLSPRNIYWRLITSRCDIAALGDVVFGMIMLTVYLVLSHGTWVQALLMIGMLIPAAMITSSFSMFSQMLAFYVMDSSNIAMSVFKSFLSPSLYPAGLFPSATKFVFTFVIPATVVGGLQIEMLQGGGWPVFVTIWAIALAWLILSVLVFRISVRRYESGNAIGLRSAN